MPPREPFVCLISDQSVDYYTLPHEHLKNPEYCVFYADSTADLMAMEPKGKLAESYYDKGTDSLIVESFTESPIHLHLDHNVKNLQIKTKGKLHLIGKLSVSDQCIIQADALIFGDSTTETRIKCKASHAILINHMHIFGNTHVVLSGDVESFCSVANDVLIDDSRSVLYLKDTFVEAKKIENKGELYFVNIILCSEKLQQERVLKISGSEIFVSNKIQQGYKKQTSEKAWIEVEKSTIQCHETIIHGGRMSLMEVQYDGDDCMLSSGKLSLINKTDFHLNASLSLAENTKLTVERSSLHLVEDALIFGKTTLEEAIINGKAFRAKELVTSAKSRIKAATIQMIKGANLVDTKLRGFLVKLEGEFDTSHLMVHAHDMYFSSEKSQMKHASINTANFFKLNGSQHKNNVVFDSSGLSAKAYVIQHHITAQNHSYFADISTIPMSQNIEGQLTLKKSAFISKNVIHNFPVSKVELLENSQLYAGTIYSEGDIELHDSRAILHDFVKTGKLLMLDRSTFQVKRKALLKNADVKLKQRSRFSALEMIFGTSTRMHVAEKSTLIARYMEMQAASKTRLQGATTCKAENLILAGELVGEKEEKPQSVPVQLIVEEQFDITDAAYISGNGDLFVLAETTQKAGDIEMQGNFLLKGGSFNDNAGKFHASNIRLGCDRYIVATRANMHGKDVVMHSPFISHLFGQITADRSLETAGLITLNLGSIIWTNNYCNNSLASLNAGLVLQNFSSGIDSVFSLQNIYTLANQVVSPLAPTAMAALNYASMLLSLATKVGNIYSGASSFEYSAWMSMRTHEWISMICEAKNVAMFGTNMYRRTSDIYESSYDKGYKEFSLLTWDKAFTHCGNFDWTETSTLLFGGHYNENTLAHANLGGSLAVNTAKSSLFHYNVGMEYSVGTHSISTRYMHNQGYTGGTYASYWADVAENAGYLGGQSKLHMKMSSLHNTGDLQGRGKIHVAIDSMQQKNKLELVGTGHAAMDSFVDSEDATTALAGISASGKTWEQSGSANLRDVALDYNESVHLSSSSQAKASGDIHIRTGVFMQDAHAALQKDNSQEDATLNLLIKAEKTAEVHGSISGVAALNIMGDERVTLGDDCLLEADRAFVLGKEVSASNKVDVKESLLIKGDQVVLHEKFEAIGERHALEELLSKDEAGNTVYQPKSVATIEARIVDDYGKLTGFDHTDIHGVPMEGVDGTQKCERLTIRDAAQIASHSVDAHAKQMDYSGTMTASHYVDIKAEHYQGHECDVIQGVKRASGDRSLSVSIHATETLNMHGKVLSAAGIALQGDKQATLGDASFLEADRASASGKKVSVSNKVKVKEGLVLKGDHVVVHEKFEAHGEKHALEELLTKDEKGETEYKPKSVAIVEARILDMHGKLKDFDHTVFHGVPVEGVDELQKCQQLTIGDAAKIEGHSMEMKAEGMDYSGAIKSDHYVGVDANRYTEHDTGTIEGNKCFVKSKMARLSGSATLNQGYYQCDQLENMEDFIAGKGKYGNYRFSKSLAVETKQAFTLDRKHHRQCDIAVTALRVNVEKEYKSSHNLSLVATQGSVNVKANVTGKKVYLESEKKDVNIEGVVVKGRKYAWVQATAGKVNLRATEQEFQGKYDTQKKYQQAEVVGGLGDADTEGAGVLIQAKHVEMDASNVRAKGHVVVKAKKSIKIGARIHTYIAEKWEKKKKFILKYNEKKYERTETDVCKSGFASENGAIQLSVDKGNVEGIGVDFFAAQGTDVFARDDIDLKGIITESHVHKKDSAWFGLSSKERNERHQEVVLVEFVSGDGDTRLHSHCGDIINQDVRYRGKGGLQFEAPNGDAYLSISKLDHRISEKRRGMSVSAPMLDTAQRLLRGDVQSVTQQMDPVVRSGKALRDAKTPLEIGTSAFNMNIHGYNTATALMEGSYGQQLAQGAGYVPKVNVSLTEAESHSRYQTVSDGGIYQQGKVTFAVKGEVNLLGVPVVADDLEVKAKKFKVKGHALRSSHEKKMKSASVGIGISGVTDASVSQSKQRAKVRHYQQVPILVNGTAHFDVDEMELDAANIECDKLTGQARKITERSRQDELVSKSQHMMASSTGLAAFEQSHTTEKTVQKATGIHVRSDIDEGDFQVGEVFLTGAAGITTDGKNQSVIGKVHQKTLHDYSHTRGMGISGNLAAVQQALSPAEPLEGTRQSFRFETVSISHQRADYVASNSSSGKTVTMNKSQNLSLDVPVGVLADLSREMRRSGAGFFKSPKQIIPLASITENLHESENAEVAVVGEHWTEEMEYVQGNLENMGYMDVALPEEIPTDEDIVAMSEPKLALDDLSPENLWLDTVLPEEDTSEKTVEVVQPISSDLSKTSSFDNFIYRGSKEIIDLKFGVYGALIEKGGLPKIGKAIGIIPTLAFGIAENVQQQSSLVETVVDTGVECIIGYNANPYVQGALKISELAAYEAEQTPKYMALFDRDSEHELERCYERGIISALALPYQWKEQSKDGLVGIWNVVWGKINPYDDTRLTETTGITIDADKEKSVGTFNPSLDMREMGFKAGRNNTTRLYQNNTGQYTSLTKELSISRENSAYLFEPMTDVTLFEGGKSGNGFYYNASINPLARQLTVHGELGKRHSFKLYTNDMDWGALGNASYRIDAGSVAALLEKNLEITPTSAVVLVGGELGLMGPSAGVKYETSEWNFMGFSIKTTIEADTGVGLKAVGEIGAKADAKRLKVGLVARVGLFAGTGAQARVKVEPGIHMPFFEEFPNAYKVVVTDDPVGMSIIEKKKKFQLCSEWEHDYFDAMMDDVTMETQIRCWKK